MKHLIGFAIAAFLVAGCQQEQPAPPAPMNTPTVGTTKALLGRYFHNPTPPMHASCSGYGGNCLGDVVITKGLLAIQDVFNTLFTGSTTDVKQAFSDNRAVLIDYVATDQVDGVINGVYTASAARNDSLGVKFLIIGPKSSPVNVYPMKF